MVNNAEMTARTENVSVDTGGHFCDGCEQNGGATITGMEANITGGASVSTKVWTSRLPVDRPYVTAASKFFS
jgi:hypothetical protein